MKNILVSIMLFVITMSASSQQNFYYGAAYYPEQLPKEQVLEDAKLMKEANFNMARMGDFAWFDMEPSPGNYNFEWLQYAVKKLAEQGVYSMLCTPTAAIPKWMYDLHPEIMQVEANGIRKPYGRRRHACLNNVTYRRYAKGITEALANAFKNSSNVVGIQIDNELGSEEPYCYCETCRQKFVKWLENKYGTIERLNKVWGTHFWSQVLTDFNQAWLPRNGDNPSAFQDFQTFESDCIIDFFCMQRDAIKAIDPSLKITHNICSSGFLYRLDQYKLGGKADFMSIDNYPYTWTFENEYGNKTATSFSPYMASLALSQTRASNSEPFWVTEAQIGRTAGLQRNILQPGIVRLWGHQEFAHGTTGICYFHWRAFPSAHEHTMGAVLELDGIPRRQYKEAKTTGEEILSIYKKTGVLQPNAKAAVIRDYNCDWAFEDGRFSGDFRYMRNVYAYYSSLRKHSVTTDIISSDKDLSKYDLIIVPSQVVVDNEFGRRLKKAASDGKTVIITCMSGLRDKNVVSLREFVDSDLTDMAGIEIEVQHSYFSQRPSYMNIGEKKYECGLWFDIITSKKATEMATFSSQYFKGRAAVTKNSYGKGTVYYVATIPQQEAVDEIISHAVKSANIKPCVSFSNPLIETTEVISSLDGKKYVYVLNFSDESQTITINRRLKDFKTTKELRGNIEISALDYKLFQLID